MFSPEDAQRTSIVYTDGIFGDRKRIAYYLDESVEAIRKAPGKVLVCTRFWLGLHRVVVCDTYDG